MGFEKQKRNSDEIILYRRGRWNKLIFTGFICFTILVFYFLTYSVPQSPDSLLYFNLLCMSPFWVILLIFATITLLQFYSYIIIRQDGIVWVRGKLVININWDDISEFDVLQNFVRGYAIGLKLGNKIAPQTNNRLVRRLFATTSIPLDSYIQIPVVSRFLIPQGINLEEFQTSRVGAILYEYAPQIFTVRYTF